MPASRATDDRDLVLSIDVGTTAVKVALWDRTLAQPLALARREYDLVLSDGRIEAAPSVYLEAIARVVPEVVGDRGHRVRALACASQGETMMFVDDAARPLGRAIVWLDSRAEAEAAALRDHLGSIYQRTGVAHLTGAVPLAKALHARRERPEMFRDGVRILLVEDYVVATLCGRVVTTASHQTSTGWFDLTTDDYADDLLAAVGLDRRHLPPLVEPGTVVGTLLPEWAAALGLPEGVQVVAGAMDQTAAALGAGALTPGVVSVALGTALVAAVTTEQPPGASANAGMTYYRHVRAGSFLALEFLPTGAAVLSWLRRLLSTGGAVTYEHLDALAAGVPAGSGGLVVIPTFAGHVAGASDRPATGAVLGLTTAATDGHLARAAMEGVAVALRGVLDSVAAAGVSAHELRLSGGGALSRVWPQIVADASGRPVLALAQAEAPSLGAAILAGWGSGLIPHGSVPGAAAENVITPDPGTARVYDHVAERHRTALAALQPYWDAEAGAPPTDPTGAA